jgi:hypothetical protein
MLATSPGRTPELPIVPITDDDTQLRQLGAELGGVV